MIYSVCYTIILYMQRVVHCILCGCYKAIHKDTRFIVWVPAPSQRGRVWRNACMQTVPVECKECNNSLNAIVHVVPEAQSNKRSFQTLSAKKRIRQSFLFAKEMMTFICSFRTLVYSSFFAACTIISSIFNERTCIT